MVPTKVLLHHAAYLSLVHCLELNRRQQFIVEAVTSAALNFKVPVHQNILKAAYCIQASALHLVRYLDEQNPESI